MGFLLLVAVQVFGPPTGLNARTAVFAGVVCGLMALGIEWKFRPSCLSGLRDALAVVMTDVETMYQAGMRQNLQRLSA